MKSQHNCSHRAGGFTLIELLVVIAIIVILAAILYPVFSSVREKARQSNCHANLHQITIALKSYREDHGRYPFQPYYDGTRYQGGISALYPDYITEKKLLVCPDDIQIKGKDTAAKDKVYSSYNGWVASPGSTPASWDFATVDTTSPDGTAITGGPKRTYNWFGYSDDGWDAFYWNGPGATNMPYATTLPSWLRNEGLSYRHYPRLSNRNAPDNTIVTHCMHHRSHFRRPGDQMDIIATVGGTTKLVNIGNMSASETGKPTKWVSQSD